jgi:hypothetical protein
MPAGGGATDKTRLPGWFEWKGGDKLPDGTIQVPWCDYGPRMAEFWAVLGQLDALDEESYGAWAELEEYAQGRKRIGAAPRDHLGKWLFAVYRGNRFVEGLWADRLLAGDFKAPALRLAALLEQGG